jgi:hypothetical protein
MDLIEGQSLEHVLHQVIDQGTNALMEATVTGMAAEIPSRHDSGDFWQRCRSVVDDSFLLAPSVDTPQVRRADEPTRRVRF